MMKFSHGNLQSKKRTFSGHIEIIADDSDSNRLFDLIEEIFIKAINSDALVDKYRQEYPDLTSEEEAAIRRHSEINCGLVLRCKQY